jgi:hypothetical protein
MELATHAQSCASAYREIGERHGWRKGRNSSRGYDALTIPLDTWDDGPHERYLMLVDHHLVSAAAQLDACGSSLIAANAPAVVALARSVFVESKKASWLLDPEATWTRRAARAHLELFANLDSYVRSLPKRIDAGYPNFRRRKWKASRDQLGDGTIGELFGKRALSGKRDDVALEDESLLSTSELEQQFIQLVREKAIELSPGGCVAAPDLLIEPGFAATLGFGVSRVDRKVAEHALLISLRAWLRSLGAWVRYNAWETATVERLQQPLADATT